MSTTPTNHRYLHLVRDKIGMKRSSLELSEHDPTWSHAFGSERERILSACACRVQVEHIGSTAIPRIRAKPILDLALLVDASDLESVAASLRTLGYDYRGKYDERPGRFYAVLDHGDLRLCQIHLYTNPDAGWTHQILFRNVLGADPSLRDEYETAKLRIQKKTGADKGSYARIKSVWVDSFFRKVLEHAPTP